MTFDEIRREAYYKVWGSAVPPEDVVVNMPRWLSTAHKEIQKDYNFWFMQDGNAIITTSPDVDLYLLPEDLKELIECFIRIGEQNDYTYSLRPGILVKPTQEKAENPTWFQIVGDSIKLFPTPSEERDLILSYWKYLIAPDITDLDFYSYEDALTRNGHEAIVHYVVWKIKSGMDAYQEAANNYEQYAIALENLKRQDFKMRQVHYTEMDYRGV